MSATIEHKGMPGHFIFAARCCFRLHTVVAGRWKVSTVGCYHYAEDDPADDNRQPLGCEPDSLYETMVFDLLAEADGRWVELSCKRYATDEEAERGHAAEVERVAKAAAETMLRQMGEVAT